MKEQAVWAGYIRPTTQLQPGYSQEWTTSMAFHEESRHFGCGTS